MNAYKITLKRVVGFDSLDFDDKNEFPSLEENESIEFNNYFGENENEALDAFRLEIPIASLEDFEIDIEKI